MPKAKNTTATGWIASWGKPGAKPRKSTFETWDEAQAELTDELERLFEAERAAEDGRSTTDEEDFYAALTSLGEATPNQPWETTAVGWRYAITQAS